MFNYPKLMSKKVQLIIVVLLTFLVYSNILAHDYLGDDRAFIRQWDFPREIRNIPKVFISRTNPPGLPLDYRPIRTAVLVVSHNLWGESKFFFRLESILIHLLATVLVYFVVRELLLTAHYSLLPFVTALLFGLHPIHTEVVDSVMVSLNNIAVVFLFASIYFYLKSSKKLPKYSPFYLLSLIFASLAFFTYEIALVLPFLLILYDFCFQSFKKNCFKNLTLRYLPYFFIAACYLGIRIILTTAGGDRGSYFLGSFYLNMIIMPKLIWKYVELLVLPLDLSFIHKITDGLETYPTPYSNISGIMKWSIFSPEVLLPGLALLSLLAICVWSYKRSLKAPLKTEFSSFAYKVVTFCIGWFFISIFPVANLVPIGVTFSERYAYLASFGYIFLGACVFGLLQARLKLKKEVIFLTILLASFYFARTYTRNYDWKDMESLTKSILRVNPGSLIARYNLAGYYRSVDLGKAQAEYQTLLNFDPRVKEAHFDLGNVYLAQEHFELASMEFNKTLVLDLNFMDAYIALGQINLSKGQLDKAKEYFTRALNVDPKKYLLFQLPKSESEIALSRSRALEGLRVTYEKNE